MPVQIRQRLERDGRITFAEFMEQALYGPSGYYSGQRRFGGDYFTSPELHPAFGALLRRQVAEVWAALREPPRFDLVEHGPGSGALCRDLLTWAEHEAPDFARAVRYVMVEPSAGLRAAQETTLRSAGLLDSRISWQEGDGRYFERPVEGCVLANEVVDAFPVHLVTRRDGRLLERYVTLDERGLTFVEGEPSTPALEAYFSDLELLPGEGCVAEVNLQALAWARAAAHSLARGALIVLDYGYPAELLYSPERRHGTLLCYRGHSLGSDPLVRVGEQDITTHVDFTSLARAGERAGLTTQGLVDQATFLDRLGLRDYLRRLESAHLSALEYEANRRSLLELIRPNGLGDVKVLIQTKQLDGFRPRGLGVANADGARSPWKTTETWLPLLEPHHMRLAGPLEAEGFGDLEAQWREFWAGGKVAD